MVEHRILVVDDEADIRLNLTDILSEFGYRVDTAEDADKALDLAAQYHYDVALLDFKLPGMNGVELYRRLKEKQSSTVALLLTAYASDETAREAVAAGAWRVLSKPVDIPLLLGLIDNVLEQPVVLVVDDDRELCATLWDIFREQGYRVALAHNIVSVAEQITASHCHVALVDLRLADADGLRALTMIREGAPHARTILITAHRDDRDQIRQALECGAETVCFKPFDTTELIAEIRRLIAT